ncbi:hypothetical protein WDW89_19005 [Deltaproteobacteria bacterium TL4]
MDINLVSAKSTDSMGRSTGRTMFDSKPALTFNQIREIRTGFEYETQPLQNILGSHEHQTMMVAMYEGTEQLLNKNVSSFDVSMYLQALKTSAQDLHKQGLPLDKFRSSLFRHSQESVVQLISQRI